LPPYLAISCHSRYIRPHGQHDTKAKAQAKLEALLLEGLEGEDMAWTPALMDEIRSEARRQGN
jgi:hypothetical protein